MATLADALTVRRYHVIGLSDSLYQNIPSLALARALRERDDKVVIVCGGSAWREPMGTALLERYPFVDASFSGAGERTFPEFLQRLSDTPRQTGLPHGPDVITLNPGSGPDLVVGRAPPLHVLWAQRRRDDLPSEVPRPDDRRNHRSQAARRHS